MKIAVKYLGVVLLIVYMVLIVFALFKTQDKNISFVFIMGGCILSAMYILFDLFKHHWINLLIMGMISISIGTLLNGIIQKA